MARIRTVKPDLFRHELLQDLQAAHPDLHPMLVFIALFGHCDKSGNFEWNPRYLKLDILPFLGYDLGASLSLLWENKLIKKYFHGEKTYGNIPTFRDHQRIAGKEAQSDAKHPEPVEFLPFSSQGNSGEAPGETLGNGPGALEGKGREGKGTLPIQEDTVSTVEEYTHGGDPDIPSFLKRGAA